MRGVRAELGEIPAASAGMTELLRAVMTELACVGMTDLARVGMTDLFARVRRISVCAGVGNRCCAGVTGAGSVNRR